MSASPRSAAADADVSDTDTADAGGADAGPTDAADGENGAGEEDGRVSGRERDDRPPVVAVLVGFVAGTVSFLAALLAAPIGGAILGVGVLALVVGSTVGSRRVLSWAAGIGVLGLAVAGYAGGAPEPLLVSGVALAVAWDVADHGLSLGDHVGREAGVRRAVLVHAGTNLLIGVASVGVVYGTYAVATGGQPVAALALLLFGAVVLVSLFR